MRNMLYCRMLNLLFVIAAAYGLLLTLMYVFQRRLMYHPSKKIGAPEDYGLVGFSEYFVDTGDHLHIQLWYRPAIRNMPTIVYYHGNAYHMGNRAGIYAAFAQKGFGVLGVSYRGYGK